MQREAAEYPNAFVPLGPGHERIETGRYTLCVDEGATVQRQRFRASELDEVIEEVRAALRARGRSETEWEVGSHAEPAGLVEMLVARGFTQGDGSVALVLSSPPPPVDPATGLQARRVENLAEYLEAAAVQWAAFGTAEEEIAARRATIETSWDQPGRIMHATWLDGQIVAAGTCAPTPHGLALFGGASLPAARGRGAYRALVAARWEYAVQLGAPALLTQGGPMSRPILTRLGFRPVGTVAVLVDHFA